MSADVVRQHLRTRPFVPFSVELANGQRVLIQRPDYAALSPGGRTLIVFTDPDDENMEIIDVPSIRNVVSDSDIGKAAT